MLRRSFLATLRHRARIAVLWMEVVIYMALEVGRAVKPRASANEDTSCKPFRAVVTVGSAAVGSCVIVTVRTFRGHANLDVDLGLCFGSIRRKKQAGDSS